MKLTTGISVIICCYNSASRIVPTLEYLSRQVFAQLIPWEVLLVDNASTDNTIELASAKWKNFRTSAQLRIIKETRLGTDHARRAGIYAAHYQYFVFCDDDNWLSDNYLQVGHDFLQQHPEVGLIGGSSKAVSNIELPGWFYEASGYYAVGAPADQLADLTNQGVWGAGMFGRTILMRKALPVESPLLNAGRVGSDAGFGEDGEMCMRVALQGAKIYFTPALQLQHFMHPSRLTINYRDKLVNGAEKPAEVMATYRRFLKTQSQNAAAKGFYFLYHFLRFYFAKLTGNVMQQKFSRDFIFFITGFSKWSTLNSMRVKAFVKSI